MFQKLTANITYFDSYQGRKDYLTHWSRDKIVDIVQATFSNTFSWYKNVRFSLKNALKFAPMVLINNLQALVQIMARRRAGGLPLSRNNDG